MNVVLYARVSTTRQADINLSIPDQLKQMRAHCAQIGDTIVTEYVEPGATGTDDARPAFRGMIEDAEMRPSPFSAIIVHSFSRFFREEIEFALYERSLKKCGVRIISITQQTSDDPAGNFSRRMFNLFDDYSSKENSKHTKRGMKENAIQGFFNGSKPPFGYQVVSAPGIGNRGRTKKKLAIDEAEAIVIRQLFDLYEHGLNGAPMGYKVIAEHLNARKILMRGAPWRIQKIHDILRSTTYFGEFLFNIRDSQTGEVRPASDWIKTAVDPIISKAQFDKVAATRKTRSPQTATPKVVASPSLLAGILKCGCCGAAMTRATGKSGKYLYYKCATRMSIGCGACEARNLAMERFDAEILENLANHVFTEQRVRSIIAGLRTDLKSMKSAEEKSVAGVKKALAAIDTKLKNLYLGIENGLPANDPVLQARLADLQSQRKNALAEIAGSKTRPVLPMKRINNDQIALFTQVVKAKFVRNDSAFTKRYIQLLVNQISVKDGVAHIEGCSATLAHAIAGMKKGTLEGVPRSITNWCARHDSNVRLLPSEGSTLSI